jgi:hypothetical protein
MREQGSDDEHADHSYAGPMNVTHRPRAIGELIGVERWSRRLLTAFELTDEVDSVPAFAVHMAARYAISKLRLLQVPSENAFAALSSEELRRALGIVRRAHSLISDLIELLDARAASRVRVQSVDALRSLSRAKLAEIDETLDDILDLLDERELVLDENPTVAWGEMRERVGWH